jgi:hypothetical protein
MIGYLTQRPVYQSPEDDKGGGGGGDKGDDLDKKAADDKIAADKKQSDDKLAADKGEDKPKDDKQKGVFLPKGRVDEMVAKERAKTVAAEARAGVLEAELSKSRKAAENEVDKVEKQLDDLEEKYTDAMNDGEKGKALSLRKQMRTLQDALIDARTDAKALAAKEGAKEEFAYNQALARYEEDYDALNPDHEDFNKELVVKMGRYVLAARRDGISGVEALKDAVDSFMALKKEEGSGKSRDDRSRSAREKAAAAAKQQPADLRDAGKDHDKAGGGKGESKSILQMTQEEFAKLPEDEKMAMRGDVL